MIRPASIVGAIALATCSGFAGPVPPIASPFLEDFEGYTPGQPAPAPWIDIAHRVDGTSVPAPSILVIDTTGPDGQPTKGFRHVNAVGDNSGAYAPITESRYHRLSTDVRIDQYTNNPAPAFGWPTAIGFTHDTGQPDIDADPQVLIYTWIDRRWYIFIAGQGISGVHVLVPTPPVITGQWVRATIQIDTLTGKTDAWIDDPQGVRIAERSVTPANWDSESGDFDGIVLFDGEGETPNPGDQSGIATYDNLRYDRLPDCPADLAEPFGALDFADVLAFLTAFGAMDPAADLAPPLGAFDFADVLAFLTAFGDGCP